MASHALQGSGWLRLLQGGPDRRGGANGVLWEGILWLGARAARALLGSNGGRRGRRDPGGGRELTLGMDRVGLGEDNPVVALSRGSGARHGEAGGGGGAAVVDLPSARRQRKKTTLPLVGWASSGDR